MTPGKYRLIEGIIELEFCSDEGDILASKEEQISFLLREGIKKEDIKEYFKIIEE